jgi:hypothetical protein
VTARAKRLAALESAAHQVKVIHIYRDGLDAPRAPEDPQHPTLYIMSGVPRRPLGWLDKPADDAPQLVAVSIPAPVRRMPRSPVLPAIPSQRRSSEPMPLRKAKNLNTEYNFGD